MINSMTGYGRGSYEKDGRRFNVEMKSVNNRYLDISVKLPRQINVLEDNIRKYISESVSRGKVDVYVTQDKFNEDDIEVSVDTSLADAYYNAFKVISERYDIRDDVSVSLIAKSPDVIVIDKKQDDQEEIWGILKGALEQAMNMFIDMRQTEGLKLSQDIVRRADIIGDLVVKVEERAPVLVDEYREKISQRVQEYLKDIAIDQTRLLNEVAFFADKASITEEIVRLKSHIVQLKSTFKSSQPIGRKLDFLLQEMNRETNTIGSKANDLYITNMVVDIKSELEKIREQIQNLE